MFWENGSGQWFGATKQNLSDLLGACYDQIQTSTAFLKLTNRTTESRKLIALYLGH